MWMRHRVPRRLGKPLWVIFAIWVLLTIALYAAAVQTAELWYLPDVFGVIAGVWIGLRYFYWVDSVRSRATLFLVTFGSLALAIIIAEVLLTPYYYATSSLNPFFGITYSALDVGVASALAAFGTPLVLFLFLSLLFAGYKASRTVYVRYE
jgi:hypothetical protein